MRKGFFPSGGGKVNLFINPVKELKPVCMTEPGQITSITGFRSTTMIVMLSVDPFSLAMVASLAERFSRSPPFV